MDIKEIAEQVSKRIYVEDGLLLSKFISEKFAEALIESYKAELLKEAGEPVAWMWRRHALAKWEVVPRWDEIESMAAKDMEECEWEVVRFFTSDQVAAAILKATKPLEDQLAKAEQLWQIAQGRCDGLEEKLTKAEQRVAEACALQVATETKFHWLDAARVAKEIRSGEWRKFVKEV